MVRKMKAVNCALAVAACTVLASASYGADNILFNGAGSSAAFNAFALAAEGVGGLTPVCGTNNWTLKGGGQGVDSRSSLIAPVTGNIWVVWSGVSSSGVRTICAYLSIDSVLGNRLFFAVPRGTLLLPGVTTSTAGSNLVPLLPPDQTLPEDVIGALNGAAFTAAPSDIRPEDALFDTTRALTPLTEPGGLGYGPGPIGATIESAVSTKSAQVVNYAISGRDPITGLTVPAFTTENVGAQVQLILVNTHNNESGHLGSSQFSSVDRFVLAKVLDGTLGCTRDLAPATGLPSVGLTVLEREPTSGTWNTLEFTVPRSAEVIATVPNDSQELGVGGTANNPLDLSGPCGSVRKRVIGTGEMVSTVGATTDSLGYAFFSFGNVADVVDTAKYLTVDGVDPIRAAYSTGALPTCVAPCPGAVTFPNVKNGSYPIWNVLRVVTSASGLAGVNSLVKAAQSQVTKIPDLVPFSQLGVFRSHYLQSGVSPRNGHKPRTTEAGGDVGGAVFTVQADLDHILDTGTELVNYKQ